MERAQRITSLANPRVRQARGLHQRREREASGLFLVDGIRPCVEALRSGAAVESVLWCPELLTSDLARDAVAAAARRGVACLEVTPEVFRSISAKENPQGVAAVVRQAWSELGDVAPGDELSWLALDRVQDPGNLGTILRTAEAVGAAGVILVDASAEPYDPRAVRASMGSVFHLRLVRATAAQLVAWRRQSSFTVVGAAGDAPTDYRDAAYRRPCLLLMGSEREGLQPALRQLCDLLVSLPMVGSVDSLNLAVSTGVILYELFERRRRGEL